VYTFTVSSDSDNINVMVLQNEGYLMMYIVVMNDGYTFSITWTTDNYTILNLTIVATDPSKENISSMFTLTVHLCACKNEGNYTTDGLLNLCSTEL